MKDSDPRPFGDETEAEEEERDEFEDFVSAFYSGDGQTRRRAQVGGCFFILPLAVILALVIFFVMFRLYK